MTNVRPSKASPGHPLAMSSGAAEAEYLLGHPVTQGLLSFLSGEAVLLDAGGCLLASSEGALPALGLAAPYPADAPFPAPAELDLPAKGLRFSSQPVALAAGSAQLCIFKSIRDRAGQDARGAQRQLLLARNRAETVVASEPSAGPQAPAEPRATILVVDDSAVELRLMEGLFARENYQVILADEGEESLRLALKHQPDLILLDAVMPGMSGFQVCRRLKAEPRTREIPVLFVTVLHGEADEVAALEAGAIDFIPKPISGPTLLARVRNQLELKHAKDRLLALSFQDSLTSIANRRQFDQSLESEWQRSARSGRPISLVMGDVDCFKNYNDHFGHAQGDACLRLVAQAFKGSLRRPGDLAARFGGEEFICILPDTDEAGARIVAEEIQAGLAAMSLEHPNALTSSRVTVSLGVATAQPTAQASPASLVAQADQYLYAAKRMGRNRIVQAVGSSASQSYF